MILLSYSSIFLFFVFVRSLSFCSTSLPASFFSLFLHGHLHVPFLFISFHIFFSWLTIGNLATFCLCLSSSGGFTNCIFYESSIIPSVSFSFLFFSSPFHSFFVFGPLIPVDLPSSLSYTVREGKTTQLDVRRETGKKRK